jgi:uncharacterized membrane protein
MRWLHILAGLTGLAAGAVALFALKGARLHRKSGIVFVYAMLFMSASGALMAALKPDVVTVNVIAGVLTFYMVLTALLTVRRRAPGFHWIDAAAMLVAVTVGLAAFGFGFAAAAGVTGQKQGEPAAMYFIFGAVALLAALGDARMMRTRGIQGPRRIARHLWRMCFGLFVAAGSFFLGQPQVFPKELRSSGLLTIPVLVVLFLMFYWLVRVRLTRRRPRLVLSPDPSA